MMQTELNNKITNEQKDWALEFNLVLVSNFSYFSFNFKIWINFWGIFNEISHSNAACETASDRDPFQVRRKV